MFCPICKNLIKINNNKASCECGYKSDNFNLTSTEKTKEKSKKGEGIIIEEKITTGFPHMCRKCGFNEAEVIDVGISVSDEAGIYIFKCLKCGFVERQADGSCNM